MAYVRISEAAELLGVSTDTVRRWVDAGKIRPARSEGQLTVDAVDLARFAAEQAHTPDPGARPRPPRRVDTARATGRLTGDVRHLGRSTVSTAPPRLAL